MRYLDKEAKNSETLRYSEVGKDEETKDENCCQPFKDAGDASKMNIWWPN